MLSNGVKSVSNGANLDTLWPLQSFIIQVVVVVVVVIVAAVVAVAVESLWE